MPNLLIAEDNPAFRRWLQISIVKDDLAVVICDTAEKALSQVVAEPTGFDILLTDIYLPKANGVELASSVLRVAPQIAVLFMSSYSREQLCRKKMTVPENAFFRKPFQPGSVLTKIDLLLQTAG